MEKSKLVKYLTRDYKLRDRSITFYALLEPRFLKEIYYTEALDVMKEGLVSVYVKPSDLKNIDDRVKKSIEKDKGYIHKALTEGIRTVKQIKNISQSDLSGLNNQSAIYLLERAENIWNEFGSFMEFTHVVGRIDVDLTEDEIIILGKFHEERKDTFLGFFKFLESVCLYVNRNNSKLKDKTFAYLTLNEIKSYLRSELSVKQINKIQNDRKKAYLYYFSKSGEEVITNMETNRAKELLSRIVEENEATLKGEAVSKGIVKGLAKILLHGQVLKEDIGGKVIVTTMTTPKMNPYLKNVAAIVTEEGGVLCHAAIFSREYNIPTITRVKNATLELKDGDLVEVDADKGVVGILERAKVI